MQNRRKSAQVDPKIRKNPKRGPRSKYTPEILQLMKWMCRSGLTDEEIARELKIHVATLYRWKQAYPELAEVMRENKEIADSKVEDSLYKRARGFWYEEIETVVKRAPKVPAFGPGLGAENDDQDDQAEGIGELPPAPPDEELIKTTTKIKRVKKYSPPDTTAAIFWLKNRLPQKWRDSHALELGGKDGGPIQVSEMDLSGLTDEELSRLEEIISKANSRTADA